MVTYRDREPSPFDDEHPCYFRTRRAAEDHVAEWALAAAAGWTDPDELAVFHAPDDIRAMDIEWDDA
jgi:hypothetical protein